VSLTIEHKANLEGERRRIIRKGGEVRNDKRVFAKGKDWPGLAMSRAMGDKKA